MCIVWHWHASCVTLTCTLCDNDMCIVWHWHVYCVTQPCKLCSTDMYIVWHCHVCCVTLTCILCDTDSIFSGVPHFELLQSFFGFKVWKQPTSEWKGRFSLSLLLWRMETAISEFLRSVWKELDTSSLVPECSLFLEVTFAISNHRITYNSTLATL